MVIGGLLATKAAMATQELKAFSKTLIDSSNFLRDLLVELEPTMTDHHKAVMLLSKMEENGYFALGNANKMCETFASLRDAFRKVIKRKAGISASDAAAAAAAGVVGGVALGVTAGAML